MNDNQENKSSNGRFREVIGKVRDYVREKMTITSGSNTKIFESNEEKDSNTSKSERSKPLGITDIFTSKEFSSDQIDLDLVTIWNMGDRLTEVGYEDGQSGQANTNIGVLARTLVYNLRSQMIQRFSASLASSSAELEGINIQKELAGDLQKRKKEYYIFLEEQKELYPSKFSLFLGVFYSVIAVVLIAADIPLARSLTRVAFDLEEWETWVLCLGIAFCTVIFKIVYDEFMSSPLDNFSSQLNHATSKGGYSDKQKRRIRVNQIVRIVFKVIVLIFTISTIYFLARLRFLAIDNVEKESATTSGGFSSIEGFDPLQEIAATSVFAENPSLTITTFIFVTIIFPLIGGICMSMGLQVFSNRDSYNKAKEGFDEASSRYSNAAKSSTILVEKKELAETNIEYCKDQKFEDRYVEFFESRYNHGFRRGFIGPIHEKLRLDKENDLFAKAEALYFKNIADRVTKKLS